MSSHAVALRWAAAIALGAFALHAGAAEKSHYAVQNLVSDGALPADHLDTNLKNPWGIVFTLTSPVWIANNGTGTSTLYDGTGNAVPLLVTLPAGSTAAANPTGIVFNPTKDFIVTEGANSAPSAFIFAAENGTITGWASTVDQTNAILAYDGGSTGAVYKGLALASNGTANFLYATDFHNNRVDVFDKTFIKVQLAGNFSDPKIPTNFAPFGIRNINGALYVTYAMQDAEGHDNVNGRGLGFVNVYDANGNFIRRLISRDRLNAPWGLALAPADFGRFSNRLLIGNFGDGTINAYDLATGEHRGRLHSPGGQNIILDGLWGLSFGNGVLDQPTSTLFFAAGTNDEANGTYGRIDAVDGEPNEHENAD